MIKFVIPYMITHNYNWSHGVIQYREVLEKLVVCVTYPDGSNGFTMAKPSLIDSLIISRWQVADDKSYLYMVRR